MQTPALLSQLNTKNQVSTRWIATQSGKQLKHVHEDIKRLLSEQVDGIDLERYQDGRVIQYWLPLGKAIYLMSFYTGERAEKAKKLVIEAIDFYLYDRPVILSENAALRAEVHRLNALQAPAARSTIPVVVGRREVINLFGEVEYEPIREVVAVKKLSKKQLLKAERAHAIATQVGISRRLEKIEEEISYMELRESGSLLELKAGQTEID